MVTVRLECEALKLESVLAELAEAPAETLQRAFRSVDLASELVRIETDSVSAGAHVVIVRLHPTDRLLGVLASCRSAK